MGKTKLLFVVAEFWQAGSERRTFEIHNVIPKDKVEVTFLSLLPLNSDKNKADYYYQKHLELGCEMFFWDDIKVNPEISLKQKVVSKVKRTELPTLHKNVRNFLDSFDCLFVMGEYVFPTIDPYVSEKTFKKTKIFVDFSVVQVSNNYQYYDKTRAFNFVSGFFPDEVKVEFAEFKNHNHTFLPLCISIDQTKKYRLKENNNSKTIGIFTRITKNKPLDMFLYAMHQLLEEVDVVLNIYGSGDPDELGYIDCAKRLSISDKVFYKGHQTEMIDTALKDEVDLVWFHGYYGFPGGFASFDLSGAGIPQIFWDCTPNYVGESYVEFPSFKTLNSFVDATKEYLNNGSKLIELSELQKEYIVKHRLMKNYTDTLMNIIQDN